MTRNKQLCNCTYVNKPHNALHTLSNRQQKLVHVLEWLILGKRQISKMISVNKTGETYDPASSDIITPVMEYRNCSIRTHSCTAASDSIFIKRKPDFFPVSSRMFASRSQAVLRPRMRASFQARFSSGIKLLNEKAKAEEDYYFSKQDGMCFLYFVFS